MTANKLLHSVLFLTLTCLWSSSGLGKPSLTPTADTALIAQIREGMKDTACVKEMGEKLKLFRDQLKELKSKIKAEPAPTEKEVSVLEKKLKKARAQYLEKMQLCGPCRTREVTATPRETSGVWYESDGTCVLEETKPEEKASLEEIEAYKKLVNGTYDRMTQSLRNPGDYTKFPHILDAKFLNKKKQDFIPNTETLPNDFNAFVALRVPLLMFEWAGLSLHAYYYHIQNTIKESTSTEGDRFFVLAFENAKNLTTEAEKKSAKELDKKFTDDLKEYISPGNRKFEISKNPTELKEIGAQWVISEATASWRYSTFAHFAVALVEIKKDGQAVLLEALLEMRRRALNEKEEGGIP